MGNCFNMRELDDFHVHLRDSPMTEMVVSGITGYGIVAPQPNTDPALDNVEATLRYIRRLYGMKRRPRHYMPVMKITDRTTPDEVVDAANHGVIALKGYPESMTTNSSTGITDYRAPQFTECLRAAAHYGIRFMGHFTAKADNPWEEEVAALETVDNLFGDHPELGISFEHLSTLDGWLLLRKWLRRGHPGFGTVTLHHALLRLTDAWDPSWMVKPSLQTEANANAVLDALLSAEYVGFGSDSAPHLRIAKRMPNPASGIWTPSSIVYPRLIQLFREDSPSSGLDRLYRFGSLNGRNFYGLNGYPSGIVDIEEVDWVVDFGDFPIIPFWVGKTLHYRLVV